MNDRQQAEHLIVMAQKDMRALDGMPDSEVFADEVFGFHAQQAGEKLLKAWLALAGQEYPKTHDLYLLLRMLEDVDKDGALMFSDLADLVDYAVQYRYEGIAGEDALDRQDTISKVRRLFDHVRPMLG